MHEVLCRRRRLCSFDQLPSQPEVHPVREEPSSCGGSNLRIVQVDTAQVLNCRSAVMVAHSRHQSCIALHSPRGKCLVHGELAAFLMFPISRDVRLTLQAQVCLFLEYPQTFIREFLLFSNPSNSIQRCFMQESHNLLRRCFEFSSPRSAFHMRYEKLILEHYVLLRLGCISITNWYQQLNFVNVRQFTDCLCLFLNYILNCSCIVDFPSWINFT